ncbi:MAG: hypothetical protein IH934_06990 [Nanoarchaeota archaeon]|nr:hypothetical protein [Nanoarchaeota archaeon]
MFNQLGKGSRTTTLFEKLLLIIGIAVGIIGFFLINLVYKGDSVLSSHFLTVIFLWLLLIFIVILTASNESIKEELSIIIKQHIQETTLIKEEIMLLNANLEKKKKK